MLFFCIICCLLKIICAAARLVLFKKPCPAAVIARVVQGYLAVGNVKKGYRFGEADLTFRFSDFNRLVLTHLILLLYSGIQPVAFHSTA